MNGSENVVIVDYGTGNLNSIKRTLAQMHIESSIASTANEIINAGKIILPGVGHFETAVSNLAKMDLIDVLNEAVLEKKKSILGICLGMELMAKTSEEGNARGLGWLDAETVRFDRPQDWRHKIPHMGWNQIEIRKPSPLLAGIDDRSEFYFAHSYHLKLRDASELLTETLYGESFPSTIEKRNIFGVQYHPEKSHDAGARLLRNFVEM